MNIRMELAIAFDEGIDEGERRNAYRVRQGEAHAARLESILASTERRLRATQSRLAMREQLLYAMLTAPEAFRLALNEPTPPQPWMD